MTVKATQLAMAASALFLFSGIAWSGPAAEPESYIDLLERFGMERVGEMRPDIVSLSSAGNNCSHLNARSPLIAPNLDGQLDATLCTLREMMAEASVDISEIVEVRVLVRSSADVEELESLLHARENHIGVEWDIRVVDALPIENDAVRLAIQLIALSPDSDFALRSLR